MEEAPMETPHHSYATFQSGIKHEGRFHGTKTFLTKVLQIFKLSFKFLYLTERQVIVKDGKRALIP